MVFIRAKTFTFTPFIANSLRQGNLKNLHRSHLQCFCGLDCVPWERRRPAGLLDISNTPAGRQRSQAVSVCVR